MRKSTQYLQNQGGSPPEQSGNRHCFLTWCFGYYGSPVTVHEPSWMWIELHKQIWKKHRKKASAYPPLPICSKICIVFVPLLHSSSNRKLLFLSEINFPHSMWPNGVVNYSFEHVTKASQSEYSLWLLWLSSSWKMAQGSINHPHNWYFKTDRKSLSFFEL